MPYGPEYRCQRENARSGRCLCRRVGARHRRDRALEGARAGAQPCSAVPAGDHPHRGRLGARLCGRYGDRQHARLQLLLPAAALHADAAGQSELVRTTRLSRYSGGRQRAHELPIAQSSSLTPHSSATTPARHSPPTPRHCSISPPAIRGSEPVFRDRFVAIPERQGRLEVQTGSRSLAQSTIVSEGLGEAVFVGVADGLGAVAGACLLEDVVDVGLDGGGADDERGRDLRVRLPGGD